MLRSSMVLFMLLFCVPRKEYYHSESSGSVYTETKRVDCFTGGLPLHQWVGMKFKVTTVGIDNVLLQLYLDENESGNWILRHELIDYPGFWFSTTSTKVPSSCPQNDGDTVIRPGRVSFLRTDCGDTSTEVHWKEASMINSLVSVWFQFHQSLRFTVSDWHSTLLSIEDILSHIFNLHTLYRIFYFSLHPTQIQNA